MLNAALLVCLHHTCSLSEAFLACLQLGFFGFNPGTMAQIIAADGSSFAIVSNNRLLCMPFAATWLTTYVHLFASCG